jgi:hypothetical protein
MAAMDAKRNIGKHPGRHTHQIMIPAVAAATATQLNMIWTAPDNVKVLGVAVAAGAAVTGDNTNRKNLNLIDAGTGAGTTEVGNLDLVTGTDLAAKTPRAIVDADAAIGAAFTLDAGDGLALQIEKAGTGVALPDLLVVVTYQFN